MADQTIEWAWLKLIWHRADTPPSVRASIIQWIEGAGEGRRQIRAEQERKDR